MAFCCSENNINDDFTKLDNPNNINYDKYLEIKKNSKCLDKDDYVFLYVYRDIHCLSIFKTIENLKFQVKKLLNFYDIDIIILKELNKFAECGNSESFYNLLSIEQLITLGF